MMHVTVDGRRRPGADPWTEALLEEWLDRTVTHSGLLVITGPRIKQFQGHIHGSVELEEGYAHALLGAMQNLAWLDLFSRKWFVTPEFVHLCTETFNLVDVRSKQHDRGFG